MEQQAVNLQGENDRDVDLGQMLDVQSTPEEERKVLQEQQAVNMQGENDRDVDLGQMLDVQSTPEEERKVLQKLDSVLLPLMACAYFLQFLDKFILGQAALFDLRQDLNLHGSEFAWTSAVFYFGYLFWSWPSSYVIVRVPIGKYLTVSVFIWGGILMCHAACKNFAGLMVARFFLGVGEAAIAPGFSLITGLFYKRKEQPLRQSAWYFGNCIAALLGGVISYGIGHINTTSIAHWKLIFLILGAVTSAYAVVLFLFLPDSPAKAVFLTPKERAIAVQRTLENKTGVLDFGSFKWNQALEATLDPQTWFLVLYTFTSNLANGGLTTFAPIITTGFGFSNFKALLLQMPLGGAEIVFILLSAAITTFIPSSRILCMTFNILISMLGMLLVWKLDPENAAGREVGLTLSVVYAVNLPISLSIISSNVAGFSKKSVVTASLFVAYCAGNIVGPQFFLASEAPSYPTGLEESISGFALGAVFLLCLFVYYNWENRRRNRLYGRPEEMTSREELADELSNKTDRQIESFRFPQRRRPRGGHLPPFPEEFAMQGLGFTAGYFPEGWFANENVESETHYLEARSMHSQHRPERVLWLGVQLARLAGEWIEYSNVDGYTFSVRRKGMEYLEAENGSGYCGSPS
ncbi:hypothetical protein VE02_09591 [Pseudogymnoascus sp. 03VT05]|nr:hypothetical protein VE02_09591 [Pseudogymnoascus sp. 03VT05]